MEKKYSLILFALVLLFVLWLSFLFEPSTIGQTYNSTSLVNTTVNISNAAPTVFNVLMETPINLVGYGNITVQCNISVFDYDNNTAGVNASFHQSTVSPLGTQDQNFRYINTSCLQITPSDFYTNYTCTFTVNYFANNGTWYCNATAYDTLAGFNTNQSNAVTINPLVAIKMDPVLDYGQLGVNQQSNDTEANITNAGNRNANISVKGYGATEGDGLAMVCTFGTIPVGNERYDTFNGTDYSFMYPLTIANAMIPSFFVPQRISETDDSKNSTFWKLSIPPGAGGVCNGKILFTASDIGN